MSNPKISIIMPVYNDGEHIEESIRCVLGQTLEEYELLCVDDGSTDETPKILKRFAEAYPERIITIRQENQGSAIARNAALAAARGDYLFFLDADDLLPAPSTLELLYTKAVEHDALIVGGSLVYFFGDTEETDYAHKPGCAGQKFNSEGFIDYAAYQYDFGFQRFLYKRSFLDEEGILFPDYLRYQDPPFFVRAMYAAGRFYALPDATYKYRTSAMQVKWDGPKTRALIRGICEVAQFAQEQNLPQLFELTLFRLNEDFWPVVLQRALIDRDLSVLDDLYTFKVVLTGAASWLEYEDCPNILPKLPDLLAVISQEFAGFDEMKAARDDSAQRCSILEQQYHDATTSTAWKLGRTLTWVPRKIKSRLKP